MQANDTTEFVSIITFNYKHTQSLMSIILFLLFVTIIKLGYFWGHKYTQYLPESSLLLFIGMGFGYILSVTNTSNQLFIINSYTFMYLLLPPIVLESAFAMYHIDFMTNIGAVLIFAIAATVLNFIFLSLSLWILLLLGVLEPSINEITILLFCALITSIDPVAVLAIFQDIHVDNHLYYLVFGESLLNDGVAVVLYNVLKQLAGIQVWQGMHYFKSCISFFSVAVGGGVVGALFSAVTCLMSRFAYKSPLSEPVIVFGMSMVAFLTADILSWSVIISMIMFGLIQVAYNFHNITHKSLILIKRLAKILANLSESIIFLSLGVTLFNIERLRWTSSFSLWSLFLCIYVRFTFTFILSAIINKYELTVRPIYWSEQYVIAYGGMRGGISYCLAVLLTEENGIDKKSIMNTTIFIIIFTVIFMGITIGPLVKIFKVKIAGVEKLSLIDKINDTIFMHLLATIEAIIDCKGRYSFFEFVSHVNTLFISPILQRNPESCESVLLDTYRAIDMRLYLASAAGIESETGKTFLGKLKDNLKTNKYEFHNMTNIEHLLEGLREDEIDGFLKEAKYDNEDIDPTSKSELLSNKLLKMLLRKKFLSEVPKNQQPNSYLSRLPIINMPEDSKKRNLNV